ncbi:MAG: hypothetical protein J0M18_02770 [Ignavibacteria bacterium]|nr:hypothetical protein [Ignavibacteria bacterium]
MKKEVLLAEFNKSHTEVLHSQILFFLKKKYHVNLWINKEAEFEDVYNGKVKIIREDTKISSLNIGLLYKVVRFIQRNKIKKVVLNTAHGILVRNLCLLLMNSKVEVIGVVHQAHKLIKSSTQKIISKKIKKYFVLNDYVKEFMNSQHKSIYRINSFYPVFFPDNGSNNNKINDKIIITVPGNVIQNRKDYLFLLKNITKLDKELKEKFQFIFLGIASKSESAEVFNLINKNKLEESFVKIYKKRVPENEFIDVLQHSDFIMPLIHPSSHSYNEYMTTEISGAFNTAFAFKKPLLMYDSFNKFEDFKNFALFYNEKSFESLLEKISNHDLTKEIKKNYVNYRKFDLDFQTENYIKFIES